MKIGILALQGAFEEHKKILQKVDENLEIFEIRKKLDIENNKIDGLILPGGESTTMGKLLHELNLFDDIQNFIKNGLPVFGTCAGMILLAKNIENDNRVHLGTMNISVKRNAYGRQLGSFFTMSNCKYVGEIPMTFIRAPYIEKVGENVEVLAIVNDNIVAAKEKNMLVTSFHPELNDSLEIHKYFINMCKNRGDE